MSTETLTLDTPELPLSDYRAIREGRELPEKLADAVTPTPETEPVADDATLKTSEDTKQDKPKPDKLNARFSELTQKIKSLQTELAAKTSPGLEAAKPAEAPIAPDPNDLEPSADKFTDYSEWLKSWNRWDRRQETRATKAAEQTAQVATARAAKAESWQSAVKAATSELADFAAIAENPDLPVSPAMADAIVESEISAPGVGTKILYRLGQTPDEAARIAKLSPVSQIREIGKLEAAILAEAAADTSPDDDLSAVKAIPVSKAPVPHSPVRGAAAPSPSKQLDTMTQAEYRAFRESGKIR